MRGRTGVAHGRVQAQGAPIAGIGYREDRERNGRAEVEGSIGLTAAHGRMRPAGKSQESGEIGMSKRLNGKQYHSGPGGESGVGVLDAPQPADSHSYEELNDFVDQMADCMERFSKGEVPPKITVPCRGNCARLQAAMNATIDVVQRRAAEVDKILHAARQGQLDYRADTSQFTGSNGKIFEELNEILDSILLPIGEGNRILSQISNGKIDELIAQTYKGDHEKMKVAVNNVATVLQGLQKELRRLTDASHQGLLSERGKPEQFQGAYAGIVKGVNEMLDAILLPIGEGNRILAQISNGKIDEVIAQTYKGDHEKMRSAINGVHAWLTELIAYVTKIANGDMGATMGRASDQDQIHEWLVMLKNNINGLAADVNMLAKASVDGKLGVRADAGKHQGEFRKIVDGFNNTLDTVVEPLKFAASQASALASSAEELTAVSTQMAGNAEETATQANVVSAASEEVSKNVSVVASGSEQMQSSIREISKSANEA